LARKRRGIRIRCPDVDVNAAQHHGLGMQKCDFRWNVRNLNLKARTHVRRIRVVVLFASFDRATRVAVFDLGRLEG